MYICTYIAIYYNCSLHAFFFEGRCNNYFNILETGNMNVILYFLVQGCEVNLVSMEYLVNWFTVYKFWVICGRAICLFRFHQIA